MSVEANFCSDDPPPSDRQTPAVCARPVDRVFVRRLCDAVRQHTNASHQQCVDALHAVIGQLCSVEPQLQPVARCVSHFLDNCGAGDDECDAARTDVAALEACADYRRMCAILSELVGCVHDVQQRSWQLANDQPVIVEYLDELADILTSADPDVCRHVLTGTPPVPSDRHPPANNLPSRADGVEAIVALAQLYQMERRAAVRRPIRRVLLLTCALCRRLLLVLLNETPLPSELAREIMSGIADESHLMGCLELLTALLSTGQRLPRSHDEMLGDAFVDLLLCCVCGDGGAPLFCQLDDDTVAQAIASLLALNLQQCGAQAVQVQQHQAELKQVGEQGLDTQVVRRLRLCARAGCFIEHCLILFNRDDDPVCVFEDHRPAADHSVLKMMTDLLSNSAAAHTLFYTNDVRALIDIVLRNLCDRAPSDPYRGRYIELCRLLVNVRGYLDHRHRCADIVSCLRRIVDEQWCGGGDDASDDHVDPVMADRQRQQKSLATCVLRQLGDIQQ